MTPSTPPELSALKAANPLDALIEARVRLDRPNARAIRSTGAGPVGRGARSDQRERPMSARAIVAGVLFRAPLAKTSKAGKPYVLATIRSGNGEAVRWWKAFVFSESAIEEINRLADGDPITVTGEFDCCLYSAAGAETRLSWSIRADAILSARAKPKTAKPQADKPPRAAPAKSESRAEPLPSDRGGRDFDDDVPF
jgi:hypothetical protein